jgi:hypothetical protein
LDTTASVAAALASHGLIALPAETAGEVSATRAGDAPRP